MNLTPTSEQLLIIDSATNFLEKQSDMKAVRNVSENSDGFDQDLWGQMNELGWCNLLLPDDIGGMGMGYVEMGLLQEKLGQYLTCSPFFDSSVLSTIVLLSHSDKKSSAETLSDLSEGKAIVSFALPHLNKNSKNQVKKSATGWLLNGQWSHIGSLPCSDKVLLTAKDEQGQEHLFLIDPSSTGFNSEEQKTLDLTQRNGCLFAKNANLPDTAHLAIMNAPDYFQRDLCFASIGLAAEQVGIAQKALDLTLKYVGERSQFGKTISSFQAVKHRCAQMSVELERSRSAVYGAACMADTNPSNDILLFYGAQAFVEATKAAIYCTEESIQLHGGMGFTWEFDLHRLLKRAQYNSQRLLPTSWWQEKVAALLLDQEISL
jgi:alkylation response protein AidB-like acyl-CoA dehydrogenase